jgi:hypothetical protein
MMLKPNMKSLILLILKLAGEAIVFITLLSTICLTLIGGALAETPHFISDPYIVSKNLLGKTGTLTLTLTITLKAAGLGDKPLAVYLTTTGGTSNNTLCINADPIVQGESKVVFSPTKGQMVTILPKNDQITFNNMMLSLTISVDKMHCQDNRPPFIRSAMLENVKLHIVQGNTSSEVLTFNFGYERLPVGYIDSTHNTPIEPSKTFFEK